MWKKPGYIFMRSMFRILGVGLFRYRCHGRDRMPTEGPLLICANHQSYFDPILVGIAFNPLLTYLARKTLFRFPPFGWLIAYLEAIPIDREGMGLGGFKDVLRRLKRGEMVVIFPEGTRTQDGRVAALKPGFVALARRGRATLLPVGIDGAYDAWPRSAKWPRRTTISVYLGEPMRVERIRELSDDDLIATVQREIVQCQSSARRCARRIDREENAFET